MNKLPRPRSGWFGPPTLAALSIALFVYSVLLLIPYLIALWLVLCPLQLLTGLGLLAFGGTKRQVGVGLLIRHTDRGSDPGRLWRARALTVRRVDDEVAPRTHSLRNGYFVRWKTSAVDMRRVRSRAERSGGYRRVLETREPETLPDRLRELAVDTVRPVRLWTARNPNTPPDALALLVIDQDEHVRWNAILDPGVPTDALRPAAELEARMYGDASILFRELVAHHPNVSDELRAELIEAGTCRRPRRCPKPWFYRNFFEAARP
ncbi:hypothetical protein [Nocardia sp. GTS18]|uniref:hypothetical protein n=1 Tax=Nocardia sp. GTS18 TaxID=1778064 RepID=UPI0015EE6190|nr:hypothetical protein [Nocardia sp. GTS18]